MEMAAVIHERDRRIYFVDLLQMNDVPTRAHARVKVVVQKLQSKTELDCIESDRRREIRRPQLADDVGDLHCNSSVREPSTARAYCGSPSPSLTMSDAYLGSPLIGSS